MEPVNGEVTIFQMAYKGDLRQVQAKIEAEPRKLNAKDDSGRTIVHWACSGGHANILAWLLEQGIDPDIRDDSRWTPLIISSSAGHESCVHLLLGKSNFGFLKSRKNLYN